jgi:hypothetical protein
VNMDQLKTANGDNQTILIRIEQPIEWDLLLPRSGLSVQIDSGIHLTLYRPLDGEEGVQAFPVRVLSTAHCIVHPRPELFIALKQFMAQESMLALDEGNNLRTNEFPGSFRSECEGIYLAFSRKIGEYLRLLRWRYNIEGSHHPTVGVRPPTWTIDGTLWRTWPIGGRIRRYSEGPTRLDNLQIADLQRIIMEAPESREPLGHVLFREAWGQRLRNPRSSLILGITAAEAAVKHFIRTVEPGASWLVDNVQSPRLDKMLKRYLPELVERHGIRTSAIAPPPFMMRVLTDGIETRNQLVHGIERDLDYDHLENVLLAVRDVLWMIDVLFGNDWARSYVRPKVLEKWDPDH